ncbi:ABC transporter ATP-binding protein [Thiobacillus sp.]|uniref:ABC transporter ATP-binding protein n=1 Tax=Thiobacillus sp. TaxID=924 RepID=UPI0025E25945|nr:ABC transporter ATP-binding protein [Thiobacillus sp.]MBT9540090.1 ABC transporter ATP-binding protein [Thiobacillus sp.]
MHHSIQQLLRRLWLHTMPRRRMQFGILFALMILAAFAEVISIGAVLPFLGVLTAPERVFSHSIAQPLIQVLKLTEPRQLLLPLTVAFGITVLVSGAMRLGLLWAQTRFSHAIGADFSISIYRRTLYQPYAVHVARNSSEVIAGISNKANTVVYSTLMPALTLLSSSMMLLAILMALVAIEPVVAFSAFAGFGGIYVLVILVTRKRVALDSQRISFEQNQVIKALQEGLGGIRDVLIDGTQATYCNIYRNADLPLRRAQANIQIIGSSPRYGIEALGMVLILALAYSLAGRSEGISGAIPVLGALALGAQRLLPVLQQAYSSWSSMSGGQVSLSDALELLDQPLPQHADEPLSVPMPFQQSITLNNLAFRYTSQSPWVLEGLNLTILKGSRIGFMGTTGSGKSTLLDIIMGLLQPTVGSLSIDGVTITPQNYRAWQAHIAHVPQAIFLADTSIAENIAFGVPLDQIDQIRLRQAAQQAQIAETIESWEKQYDTLVGERGIRLSGGQRQRIGIARALYKKANVIVFDEATSALDNDTERAVMKAIESLGDELTILIVAHRLSTLKNCTQIVELSDGQITRRGSYAEIVDPKAESF